MLGVGLDPPAQGPHEPLDVGGLVVEEPVALAVDTALVQEDPGVAAEAGDGRPDVIVELEYLPEVSGVLEGAVRGLVRCEDHALRGVNPDDGSPALHELQCVLNLIEAPLGREYGDGGVVLVGPHHRRSSQINSFDIERG